MKYVLIVIAIIILIISYLVASAPQKKLRCVNDVCYILEKSAVPPKPKISQKFRKSEVRYVDIATQDGNDYIVVKTYSGDIYLKFIHTPRTAFKSKNQLKAEANQFFINLVNSDNNVNTKWQRDLGSIQIYMFGKPLLN